MSDSEISNDEMPMEVVQEKNCVNDKIDIKKIKKKNSKKDKIEKLKKTFKKQKLKEIELLNDLEKKEIENKQVVFSLTNKTETIEKTDDKIIIKGKLKKYIKPCHDLLNFKKRALMNNINRNIFKLN